MKATTLLLPSLALGAVVVLIGPAAETFGFTTIGGSLDTTQRDVRVFDNFVDPSANNNTTPDPQFPGFTGVEMTQWKAVVEWGSRLHGDGTGDSTQAGDLGSGGANFDAAWAGVASGVGMTNDNIISALQAGCGGTGVLAFTETPIMNGWRIRYCEEWGWQDGPDASDCTGPNYDLQGVGAHEYGHALGLGHSGSMTATMFPSTTCANLNRSIDTDDINGVQFLYGVVAANKPMIDAISISGATITITGSNFSAIDNEVWFTNASATDPASDPRVVVSGVASTAGGTSIMLNFPPDAGPGDVLVKADFPGNASLSNAFPADVAFPPAAAIVYGCGVNPVGSMSVLSGVPSIGTTVVLGLDNPLSTQAIGSIPFLVLAFTPDPAFPCGTPIPGFGMGGPGAPGELLISLAPPTPIVPIVVGPLWAGAGTPSAFSVGVPNDPALLATSVFGQGLLLDPTSAFGVKFGLTDGVELQVGP